MKKVTAMLLCFCLLLSALPRAEAFVLGEPYHAALENLIENPQRRSYVQMMLDHYLRTDSKVKDALKQGQSAVFLFDGCSDNMDHPEYSQISYYRVSAVCIAVRLNRNGEPYIAYFNGDSSTIPDRPLDYTAWYFDDVGEVGPATVCDGTYELYSVHHGGNYEALHMRTSQEDGSISAVYMNEAGYVNARATEINIHTRTGNHVISRGMWSAGCILVGGGDWAEFMELMDAVYYNHYDIFEVGLPVGTITINRQYLAEKMYELYENPDAVDMLLAQSRHDLPETYLYRCKDRSVWQEGKTCKCLKDLELMSLPCSNPTDARSLPVLAMADNDKLVITGQITNTEGRVWYETMVNGQTRYVFSGYVRELDWFETLMYQWFGI